MWERDSQGRLQRIESAPPSPWNRSPIRLPRFQYQRRKRRSPEHPSSPSPPEETLSDSLTTEVQEQESFILSHEESDREDTLLQEREWTPEMDSYVSPRMEKFTGRPGSQPLREFKSWYEAVTADYILRHGTAFTPQLAMQQMSKYLAEEAWDIYDQHRDDLLASTNVPNPAFQEAIRTAQTVALASAVQEHMATEGKDSTVPVPTSVLLSQAQLLAATQGIPATFAVPLYADPVAKFFEILEIEFPTKSSDKLRELTKFAWKKDESLKMMYRRLRRLQEDTRALTDENAAHKFLQAIELRDDVLHTQVCYKLFNKFGDQYSLRQAYDVAERLELARAHYLASTEHGGTLRKAARDFKAAGKESSSLRHGISKHAGAVAMSKPSCNFCAATDHVHSQCTADRSELHCSYCDKDGHVERVCFQKYPERNPFKEKDEGNATGRTNSSKTSSSSSVGKAANNRSAASNSAKTAANSKQKTKQEKVGVESLREELSKMTTTGTAMAAELAELKAQISALSAARASASTATRAWAPPPGTAPPSSSEASTSMWGFPYHAMMADTCDSHLGRMNPECEDLTSHAVTRSASTAPASGQRLQLPTGVPGTRRDGRELRLPPTDPPGLSSDPEPARRGVRAALPRSFQPLSAEEEQRRVPRHPLPPVAGAGNHRDGLEDVDPGTNRVGIVTSDPWTSSASGGGEQQPTSSSVHPGVLVDTQATVLTSPHAFLDKLMTTPTFSCKDLGVSLTQLARLTTQVMQPSMASMAIGASHSAEDGPLSDLPGMVTDSSASGPDLMDLFAASVGYGSKQIHQAIQDQPLIPPEERLTIRINAALVDNRQGCVCIEGLAPKLVLLDSGAQPVIVGHHLAAQLLAKGLLQLQPSTWQIQTAGGQVEPVVGETTGFLKISFRPGSRDEVVLHLRCLVTRATTYDLLLGTEALYPPGVAIDLWVEQAYFRPQWRSNGHRRAFLPLDLHGKHIPSTAAVAIKLAFHTRVWNAGTTPIVSHLGADGTMLTDPCSSTAETPSTVPYSSAIASSTTVPRSNPLLDNTKQLLLEARKRVTMAHAQLQLTSSHAKEVLVPIPQGCVQWCPPTDGIVMVELFAGMATGLEAVLQAGMMIKQYVYCDINPVARQIAEGRMRQLHALYPKQFPTTSWQACFTTLSQDIRLIQPEHVRNMGPIDLLIAGWECQGFSAAGPGMGLSDPRSGLFTHLLQFLAWAQLTSPHMGYILENSTAQLDARSRLRQDMSVIQHFVGRPLVVDAAQCGSYAHRLRNFWTNLAPLSLLEVSLLHTQRDSTLQVSDILDAGRVPQVVDRREQGPWFPANTPGKARSALPTLVSYPNSHAFKDQGPGMVWDTQLETWQEPNADERERAMGFTTHTTQVKGITERQRREVLGRAIDLRCLTWIFTTALMFQMLTPRPPSCLSGSSVQPLHADSVHLSSFGSLTLPFGLDAGGGEVPIYDINHSFRWEPDDVVCDDDLFWCATASSMANPEVASLVAPRRAPAVTVAEYAWNMGEQLSEQERARLRVLILQNADVFAFSMKDLQRCTVLQFRIQLDSKEPIWRRRHRLSQHEWELVDERCKELHEAGLIRPSNSSFAAATVMPAKKDSTGLWTEKRMCGDYRPINAVTPQDRYPMPTPEDIFDSLGKSRVFSILDLRQGFNQIAIVEEDCHKTAFHGWNQLWEWIVMPFGLKNAPITFQRVMDIVLSGFHHARCYIDDVLVHSEDFDSHLLHLAELFRRLRAANMRCHPSKCEFGVNAVVYLGHRIVPNGITPDEAKVAAIMRIPVPTDVPKLRAWLGLVNYYRRYIPDHSIVAKPLFSLLKKDMPWSWSTEAQVAFESLRDRLIQEPILRRPDYNQPFILHTDWSANGIGAVLAQQDEDGNEYVVAYASRSNNKAEGNYSSYEGECLAVVWAVAHFRPYLYGRKFTLFSDHQPLHWLMTNDKLSGKLARWALILQEYEFDLVHRPGVTHQNADILSRNPGLDFTDLTSARQDFDDHRVMEAHVAMFLSLVANVQLLDDTTRLVATADRYKDIWLDDGTMGYLQQGSLSPNVDSREKERIQQRAKRYLWRDDHLVRVLPEGERVVPPPQQRPALVNRMHIDMGHFGVKRTYSLLTPHFHWYGMHSQVKDVVARCEQCDRVRAHFTARQPQMHPLPIQGLFYRWSCDLAGEFAVTPRGNRYIMVMIEHFSKWLELVALPDKSARSTSQAFLQNVLSRFGACAECLTDQGSEFRGEFQELLDYALVDHRRTSRDNPQANGLAERAVQTAKRGLRKLCLTKHKSDWDLALPYLAMGYRMSKHASLSNYSPYLLLFGREPLPPSAIATQMHQVVDLDNPDIWAQVVSERAALFQRIMPMAMQNLAIAQHRDTLRYAYTRGGSYLPKARKFVSGDFVYLQRKTTDTLDTPASRIILRVQQVKPSGVLVLQGSDGRVISDHSRNCAPCHLPNLDPTILTTNWIPPRDYPCKVCRRSTEPDQMLLCDGCNDGYHLACLNPELSEAPAGLWFCPSCQRQRLGT